MALQTDRLAMAALGVLGDIPPNTIQPPLVDGIHLRWSVRADLGFPWHGFFLFRRPHRPGRPVCFGQILPKTAPGPWPSPVLNTPFGQFSSDRPLVFTDDFPAAGVAEFDLRDREYLRFSLDSAQSAYRAEAQIGFRKPQGERTCIDFRPRAGFGGPNPLIEADTTFEVRGKDGTPAAQTQVRQQGLTGLDCGFRLEIALPCKAGAVELTLAHFSSPGKVSALNSAGAVVVTASIPTQQGVPHVLDLSGDDIVRVVVDAPQDETLLQQICFRCGTADGDTTEEVTVNALHGDLVVVESTAHAAPGQVVTVVLDADSITAIEVSGADAALNDLCLYLVSQNATSGWESVPDVTAPMCLPVMHPQYPCAPQPTSEAVSEALALGRIRYGPSAEWAGEPFSELHAQLVDLVRDGPAGVPMALRQSLVGGTATPPDPDVGPPTMLEQYPLQLVLLASVHPAVAQMLGLYWADKQVQQNQSYDYLIVADHTGAGHGKPATVLGVIAADGFVNLDGYIVFNRRLEPAPPFDPPGDVRAYALPGPTIAAPDGGAPDGTNNAGLRWDLDQLAPGVLAPGAALMYHVWRADRGNAAAPGTSGTYALVTPDPVLVAEPQLPPGAEPVRSLDWPPFPLGHTDRALADGWYSYRVSGIDIFGRHSPAGADARWFQWAPAPTPRPWYYQDLPAAGLAERVPRPHHRRRFGRRHRERRADGHRERTRRRRVRGRVAASGSERLSRDRERGSHAPRAAGEEHRCGRRDRAGIRHGVHVDAAAGLQHRHGVGGQGAAGRGRHEHALDRAPGRHDLQSRRPVRHVRRRGRQLADRAPAGSGVRRARQRRGALRHPLPALRRLSQRGLLAGTLLRGPVRRTRHGHHRRGGAPFAEIRRPHPGRGRFGAFGVAAGHIGGAAGQIRACRGVRRR